MKGVMTSVVIGAPETSPQAPKKETAEIGDQRKYRDFSDTRLC